MQQRQLRLGDILDDYCPRERRVTNHVIVAMVEQDIKQTRCSTCEAEHEYKHAKVPPQRRKKAEPGTLYKDVLAGLPKKPQPQVAGAGDDERPQPDLPIEASGTPPAEPDLPQRPAAVVAERGVAPPTDAPAGPPADDPVAPPADEPVEPPEPEVEGPVHRPLIRATLPRPEGQPPARPIPEFTARQAVTRPGRRPPAARGPRGPQGFGGHAPAHGPGRGPGRRGQGVAAAGHVHGGRGRSPNQQGQGNVQGQGGQGQGGHRRRGGKKRFK
jgi:hypothetical protein